MEEIDIYIVNQGATVPYVIATPPSRDPWLINSPWQFILSATFGPYGSIDSDPVTVPFLDPCFDTIVL